LQQLSGGTRPFFSSAFRFWADFLLTCGYADGTRHVAVANAMDNVDTVDSTACFTTGAITKSTDGGATWVAVDKLLYYGSWVYPQINVSPVAIDPLASSTVYAAWSLSCDPWDPYCAGYGIVGDHWISKSADGGASWSRISDLSASALWFDALTPTVLYAATDSSVLQSTDGGVTWSTPGAPVLTSLSLQPTSVPGGGTSTGTVTLNAAAPAGGTVVTLSSSNTAVAAVPASVTVPAGATTVGFAVTTNAVTSATAVTISATSGGGTRSAALTVTPAAALLSITLSPNSVKGGTRSTGTITLSTVAPLGGVTVTVSSSHLNIATVPSSITVAAGATSAQFTVSTSRPKSSTDVTISANLANVTKAATLTVKP
jgi:hypothetical protein